MNLTETPSNTPLDFIEILTSEDDMIGYIKLTKQENSLESTTKEQLMEALAANKVVYGMKESAIEKLGERPIFNLKIEVARGLDPIKGEDGQVTYYVKRDSEYQPEYSEEGKVDYKNLDYFQLVKKGQLLCEMKKETKGTEGMNIFGGIVPGKDGRKAPEPKGKNTEFIENDTKLVASCDGVVSFLRDKININDMLRINDSVNQLTGNINFSGDVTIDGDVCEGFSVNAGGNLIVKGVVEGARIEAAGNVHISNGINGAGRESIHVGKDLRCKYIENATIQVEGDISADYIIDSKVTCFGNIELVGGNELIVGGEIKVRGELKAKEIGTDKERITRVEVLGTRIIDEDAILQLKKEIEQDEATLNTYGDTITKYNSLRRTSENEQLMDQLEAMRKQIFLLKERIKSHHSQIQELENSWSMEYYGAVICKRKIYQGVKINFGDEKFRFGFDNIEHCRIYWNDGQIVQSTL